MSSNVKKINAEMNEEESEDWFDLKQELGCLILKDIGEEWMAGNQPSTIRIIYETYNYVKDIIRGMIMMVKGGREIKKGDSNLLLYELYKWVLKDIEEEWAVGNIPSLVRLTYEIGNTVKEIIEETIIYLKELSKIYILHNKMNNSEVIIEEAMFEALGIKFDKDKK